MATSGARCSCVVLAVALAYFCFFISGIADASAPALNSQQHQQIGDHVLSGGFRRSLLQVPGPPNPPAPEPSTPPAGSSPAVSPSDVPQGPPTPAPSPSSETNIPPPPSLPPSNGPTPSQPPPPTRPPGNFFTPGPAPAPAQAPIDNGAVANPPPFDPYTPPPPDFLYSSPPPPADNSSSSKKSTTRAAVGATVGVALVFLVALGAVVFLKPEWLPCCKEDRSRQAQYERHMTDF